MRCRPPAPGLGTYEHHVEHHHVVDHDEQAACRRAQKPWRRDGGRCVDLLSVPRRRSGAPAGEARIGERMAFSASVRGMRVVPMNVRRGYRLRAVVDDGDFAVSHYRGAAARLVFFSYKKQYVDWLSMRLRSGAIVVIAGEPSEFNGQLQVHPSRNNDGRSRLRSG